MGLQRNASRTASDVSVSGVRRANAGSCVTKGLLRKLKLRKGIDIAQSGEGQDYAIRVHRLGQSRRAVSVVPRHRLRIAG